MAEVSLAELLATVVASQLWVIDDAGASVPTQAELFDELQDILGPLLGGDYLWHPEDPITQLGLVHATLLARAYQLVEAVINSRDPAQAQGVLLRELGTIVGAEIPQRTRSVITGRMLGTPGTLVPAQSIVKYLPTGDLWRTFQSYTIGASGSVDVEFESQEFAAIEADAAGITSWQIQTPVNGWSSFLSTAAADVGRAAATNAETRAAIALAATGGAGKATYDSDVQNVASVDGVTHVALFVNREITYDATLDLQGKEARFIVEGGRKQDLFDAIAESESTGLNTQTTGDVQGSSTRSDGKVIDVSFSRPTDVPVLVRVTISGDLPDLADTTSIVYEQVEARAAEQDFGESVVPVQYVGPVILGFDENAIESCTVEMRLDSGDPWVTTPLVLDQTERADISAGPRPASVISVAEDPISVGIGLTLNINPDGGGIQSYVTTEAHTSVSSLIEEIADEFTLVEFVDSSGRLLIRTESAGASSSLVLSGDLLLALGITAATYNGTNGDITVVTV